MLLPIKTNDIVEIDNKPYLVRAVKMTPDGAVLDVYAISRDKRVVHAAEVNLLNEQDAQFRAKAIGADYHDLQRIDLPAGMSKATAQRILQTYLKQMSGD